MKKEDRRRDLVASDEEAKGGRSRNRLIRTVHLTGYR